ncbi:MAG: transglycosylase domain-containing protein [Synechococcus sp.]|nr:transglycosylase domain-containing protein [Synechococcus sp.]
MTPRLQLELEGVVLSSIPLHGQVYRIGRGPDAELTVNHAAVSKRHALLEQIRGVWQLRDCGSTNGLSWRGRRVQWLQLRDGDQIQLGPEGEKGLPLLRFCDPQRWHSWERLARPVTGVLLSLAGAGLLLLALGSISVPVRGSLAPVRGPLVLYDSKDRPLGGEHGNQPAEATSLAAFSPALLQALLSSEDTRFWWHPGIDAIGTGRALITNLLGGRVLEGGSTLTQQLARSLYPEQVGQSDTLARKWRELLVALQLEARFSKRELLLSYLNRVYLGVGWGFERASRAYFGIPARELNLSQAALLVGLLPSPHGHDPCRFPEAALQARNRVLSKMVNEGRLGADAARKARRTPLQLAAAACSGSTLSASPFYSDQVHRDLSRLLGPDVAAEGNFLVSTHLDPELQALVEHNLRQTLKAHAGLGIHQGAVVVLDSRSGGVLSLVGGRDYSRSQFNRATQALRQPGSTFKLFTYLVALERGVRPTATVPAAPLGWGGVQYSSGCGGSTSLRQAFASSNNCAALRLARRFGLEAVVNKARDLGISTPLSAVPGMVLGQKETSLLELTAAYGAVANNGIWMEPTTVRQLTDAEPCRQQGQACRAEGRKTSRGRRVISSTQAQQMQGLLRAVVQGGTGAAARLGGAEGGKTGTTNDGRDLLFVGYEPKRHWVMGIWLGNDDNSPTAGSSALAAQLWHQIMSAAAQQP